MNEIEVSIVCLAYNHEKYIRKALDGFVNQKTNFKYEIIIHDDASTDNTASIIKEYEEKYKDKIVAIYQKENQHSKGINIIKDIMLPMSKGKYVALCEGDDYWVDKNKLQKQYDALENNPSCFMCASKTQYCDDDNNLLDRFIPEKKLELKGNRIISKEEMSKMLFSNKGYAIYPFHTSSYFMKNDIDYSMEIKYDSDVLLYCVIKGDVYYIDEIMSNYRINTSSSVMHTLRKSDPNKITNNKLYFLNRNILFNKMTDYIYNDLIISNLNFTIAGYIPIFNDNVKKFMKDNHINYWTILKTNGFVMASKYIFKRYFNSLFIKIKKLQKKDLA